MGADSAVLINAMLKEKFPPISLPKREYMENAKQIWEELGLPALKPETPWYGYSLGEWDAATVPHSDHQRRHRDAARMEPRPGGARHTRRGDRTGRAQRLTATRKGITCRRPSH